MDMVTNIKINTVERIGINSTRSVLMTHFPSSI